MLVLERDGEKSHRLHVLIHTDVRRARARAVLGVKAKFAFSPALRVANASLDPSARLRPSATMIF